MAESYLYTSDATARLVLAGWMTNLFVYSNAGGKIYAERLQEDSGFLGLFPAKRWVAANAQSLAVRVTFQGLLPGAAPAYAQRVDGGADRHQAETSIWGVGLGIKVDMVGGSVAPDGAILPNPSPTIGPTGVDVRGLQVNGSGTIDNQQFRFDPIRVGAFISG